MNPLPPGYIAYESRFPRWVDWLTVQLDYAWFLALLAWTLVLVVWWWHPRRKSFSASPWAWLPWSAAAGLLSAVIEFILINSDSNPANHTGMACNLSLGFLPMLAAAGWWWQAASDRGRWLRLAGALVVLPLATIAALRYYNPLLAGWWLAGAAIVAVGPWLWRAGGNAWSRTALVLVALGPLFSNVGPLAIRWALFAPVVQQNAGALGAGVFQALTAGVALAGFGLNAWRSIGPEARRGFWPDARPFAVGAGLWAAMLLAFGLVSSSQQVDQGVHYSFEQLRRLALQFNPRQLAAALGPEVQIDPGSMPAAGSPSPLRLARAPRLTGELAEPLARVLTDVTGTSRSGLKSVSIVTLREGWLVVALSGLRSGPPGQIRLARRATDNDQLFWDHRMEYAELALAVGNVGTDFFRLPLLAENGAMLGWLEFLQVRGGNPQMRARTAPFVGTVLGVLVAALFFGQRRSLQSREAAVRAAAVAAESARVKTDFLAKVSHELRTPLQSILGYGELLEADVRGETGRMRLAALRQNGEFMLRLVNDLLDLSAIEAGGFRFVEKPTALAALLRETIESLRPRVEIKGLALACHVEADFPPWVTTDGERFRQIVLNLAGNAVKFTERGRIDVALWVVESGMGVPPVSDNFGQTHGRDARATLTIELAVRDTGPGIAPEDQALLFQPFSRLELTSKKEGTGLGLALTAALCRSHDGDLTVESDGRTGACFRARLRLRLSAPPAAVPTAEVFPSLRGRRVLVADDNALVRDLFAAWLTDLGAICEMADDGEQALARASEHAFDAVILDLAMPRLDGLGAARRLRALGRPCRIVGVSAHASGRDRAQALAAGMDGFLTKPVELHALAAALVAGEVPALSAEKRERLRAQLIAKFRGEVADNASAIREALACCDWPSLHARVHYLKSSAGVIGDDALYDACTAVEDAADANAAALADVAWAKCEVALTPWLT